MATTKSAEAPGDGGGRARILDAAIARFAADGFAGTSLKAIADDADVSPALIIHHFGSKDALRDACDSHVVDQMRTQMRDAMEAGAQLDVLEAFRRRQEHHAHALPYIGRALSEGSASAVRLVDDLAEETIRSIERSVEAGLYVPSEHPRERALVLLVWSLGAVVLHEHVRRLLGADLTGEPRDLLPYLRGASELLDGGLFTDELRDNVRAAIARLEQE